MQNNFTFNTELNGQIVYASEDTGASEVSLSKKGGAMFLSEGTNYTMSGGTISGVRKEYGGAFYVSSNATLTINGGTITSCAAKYGGAIYVAAGGTCILNGGNIISNTAEKAPAIYVESGGTFQMGASTVIKENRIAKFTTIPISSKQEQVGGINSGLKLYTTYFGSYPQSYVGDTMREELEDWFITLSPNAVKTYTMGDGTKWLAYEYRGDLYARGTETKYNDKSMYKDNTSPIEGRISWFKVEPIKWYVRYYNPQNFDLTEIQVISVQVLAASTPYNASRNPLTDRYENNWATSDIRSWCNGNFFNEAFSPSEQSLIQTTTLQNCKTDEYYRVNWTGEETEDNVYLESMFGVLTNYNSETAYKQRLSSGTDFAIANHLICCEKGAYGLENEVETYYGTLASTYYLRSAGSGRSVNVCAVRGDGRYSDAKSVYDVSCGVRPCIKLRIA